MKSNKFAGSSSVQQQQQQQVAAPAAGRGHICQCLSRISTIRYDRVITIYNVEHQRSKTTTTTATGLQFVESVVSLAQGLSKLGVRAGDTIAIAALNSDLYLQWLLAVAFVGGIAAPLNYRWSLEEATSAIEAINPVMLVLDETCHNTWYNLHRHQQQQNQILIPAASLKWYVFIGNHRPAAYGSLNLQQIDDAHVLTTEAIIRKAPLLQKQSSTAVQYYDYCWAPDGIALICFTSGTTGRPKGVAVTHTALIVQSLAKIAILGYTQDDVYLHTAPLCHIGGISSCITMLMAGASHVFIPKFEPTSALQAIQQHHVTAFITVPAMMFDLISFINKNKSQSQSQKQTAEDQQNGTSTAAGLKSINKILNGGGGLSTELINECAQIFPTAKLVSAYGMTETCSSLTFMTLYDPASKKNGDIHMISESKSVNQVGVYVGKPAPHVELRISDEGSSPIGRIFTRGPHVMLKYWDQIMASDQGWIDTGDIGRIDGNGNLWLVGRTKDRIRSGGENVYPEEVESILCQHPGVSHALVVGIPDGRLSEMVVGCIRVKKGWHWIEGSSNSLHKQELGLSTEILQTYCKEMNLSRFKIPKVFIVWSQPFPLTSTGKLRRNEVRRDAISHLQLFSSKL